MPVTSMWKIRLAIFQGIAGNWLSNIFSNSTKRAERYRQAVAEEAFEIWMNSGEDFARAIEERMGEAKQRGAHSSVRFWQDVFALAHEFDSNPENRRKREIMPVGNDNEAAA